MRKLLGAVMLVAGSLGAAVAAVHDGPDGQGGEDDALEHWLPAHDAASSGRPEFEFDSTHALADRLRARLDAAVEPQHRESDESGGKQRRRGGIACGGCGRRAAKTQDAESTESTDSTETRDVCSGDVNPGSFACCGMFELPTQRFSAGGARTSSRGDASRSTSLDSAAWAEGFTMLMTAQSARIEGLVVDAQTGDGAAGISLHLWCEGETVARATTDESGAFVFAGLEAGTYIVSTVDQEPAAASAFESAPLALSVGQVVLDLVLASN